MNPTKEKDYPFLELLDKSLMVKSLDEYLHILVETTTGNTLLYGDFATENMLYNTSIDTITIDTWISHFDNCITVDFTKDEIILRENIAYIWIEPDQRFISLNMSLEIVPLDRHLFTDRNLKNTRLFYSGKNIVIDKDAPLGSSDDYILELRRDVFVEQDRSKNCRNFPTSAYESYNECDKNFTLSTLAKHYGPNFLPIWATFDLDSVTRSQYIDWSYDYFYLFDGTTKSDCPLPCTTTSLKTRFLGRKQVTIKQILMP